MREQFGGVYWQNAVNVSEPINNTYVRLFRDLADGLYKIKKFGGTIEIFETSLLNGIGGSANVGWTNNSTQMSVTTGYQIIIGPLATRYSSTSEFIQNTANALEIKYIGANGANIKLEFNDTHTASGNGVANLAIFKNGIIIPDSEFQSPLGIARALGQCITIELSANTNDIFDVRTLAAAPINVAFRYLSFIATKLK